MTAALDENKNCKDNRGESHLARFALQTWDAFWRSMLPKCFTFITVIHVPESLLGSKIIVL